MSNDAQAAQQDIKAYLRIFWRWRFLFAAFLVIIPTAVYFVERGAAKTYQSSSLTEFQDVSVNLGATSAPITTGNINAVAQLITTTPVAEAAARLLRPSATPKALLAAVAASADSTTGFVTITATAHSASRAAAIANAFTQAIIGHQSQQAVQSINRQIVATKRQLAALPPTDQVDRGPLIAQLARLRGLKGATNSGAQVIEPATAAAAPIGPKVRQAVELALIIAFLLGFGAVLIAENGDRRLRRASDLESITSWPLLGVIPSSAFDPNGPLISRDVEAFQMLRATLTYFNVERPHRTVAVVSPLVGDGKTTISVGLAIATARAGKLVVLVDADLRRAAVAERLGISAADGLGAVLAQERELDDVLFEYPVDDAGGGKLLVLPAGGRPPNPTALLTSERMRSLLKTLEEHADFVVIDTAAMLAVSDALPVVQHASGVVVVARMNRSSGAAVRRMQKVMTSVGGNVLGVVATGSGPASAGYGDYAAYGIDQKPASLSKLRGRLPSIGTSTNGADSNGGSEVHRVAVRTALADSSIEDDQKPSPAQPSIKDDQEPSPAQQPMQADDGYFRAVSGTDKAVAAKPEGLLNRLSARRSRGAGGPGRRGR